MKVSVVIPVYNAEEHLRTAVESALAQSETDEVILVEDCSRDNSLNECRQLAKNYCKVKVIQHSPPQNRGAGASRNLGVTHARCNYIAFLDADDFYLKDRFATAARIFTDTPEVDGVYETIGTHFEDDEVREAWLAAGGGLLTGFREKVSPELLFENQAPMGFKGYAHADAWVIKKSVFGKVGLFDEELYLHQDTAMALRLSASCHMAIGDIDQPVAMRRVHTANRITAKRSPFRKYSDSLKMWRKLWCWGKYQLKESHRALLLERYIDFAAKPFVEIEYELNRISLMPAAQLFYALSKDMGLVGEKLFRQKLKRCSTNFIAYLGLSRPRGL